MTTWTYPGSLQRHSSGERGVNLTFERGRMRLSFLADGIVRVRFTPEREFAPRRSWDVVEDDECFPPAQFSVEEGDKALSLAAGPLTLSVSRANGCVSFTDHRGERFAADVSPTGWRELDPGEDRAVGQHFPEGWTGPEIAVTKGMAQGEGYYGFGQRIGLLDRRGRRISNWTVDPATGHGRSLDNMYQSHPFFMAVRPGLAWGAFLHSTWYSRMDVGATNWNELRLHTYYGELDYYMFYGPTPAEVLERLTRLTGRPFLPPLWALGYHQSRWGYIQADEFRETAREFRDRDIPADVIHFDIDYMRGYRDFTWDPERIPDPKGLISDLREKDIRAVTIIDPGVKHDPGNGYEPADDGMAKGMFITSEDGTPFIGYVWPDEALFPDFAREEVREWWGEQHRGHVEAGVSGIWNDMNEPAIFDRPFSEGLSQQKPMPPGTPQGGDGERTVHAEVHNLYGLLMSRATHEGLSELRPGMRPWVLTRSGFTGVQRYAAAWMGDNSSWWEHLEASLSQLMSMGLSGVPHVGVDIGGFFENPSAELYARWIELGAFYPFMRTHSVFDSNRQEPWSFGPEIEEISRRAIKLRYRLLPYLYTLAHEAHRTGAPLFRPLLYDFPNDPATFHLHDQVMVGPHLMVAPVYHPGREHRIAYLPEGAWHSFPTGERHDGPKHVALHAPLGKTPIFVRGGAVLPLGNDRSSTSEPLTELALEVYPAGESEWTLIEDDGESLHYREGDLTETTTRVTARDGSVSVRIDARSGSYKPHRRTLTLRVHLPWRPAQVTLDGTERRDWEWDGRKEAAGLRWEDDGQAHEVALTRGS